MTERHRVQLVIAIALVGFILPASADAKTGYRVHPGSTELILPVENAGGRVISISANSQQRVQLLVEKPSSMIEYATKGHVTSRRVKADFGTLGQIDVRLRFARFGPGVFRREHCNGRDPIEGKGIYRGAIQFAQERGVPEISVTRGHAYFERQFRQVCPRQSRRYKPDPFPKLKRKIEEGQLTVHGTGDGRTVRLDATIFALRRNPAQSGGTVRATVYERHEKVRITRSKGALFEDSIVMSKRGRTPETIEVELPEPFTGRALYSRRPNSPPSWTGDLHINLPGADQIPLTGSHFSTNLCRGKVDSCL